MRKEAGDSKAVAGVQAAVQGAVGTEGKNRFDKLVAMIFGTQTVAVTYQAPLAVDNKGLLLFKYDGTKLRAEIILHPHVVVASEVVNDDAFFVHFVQFGEEQVVAAGHHILVLEPIVEDITQEKQVGATLFDLVEPVNDFPLAVVAFLTVWRPQMEIRGEENVAVDGNRLLESGHFYVSWN